MKVLGLKTVKFNNGDIIQYNIPDDFFQNTIFGTLNHLINGQIKYEDKKNNLVAYLDIGSIKKKPKDYFEGRIEQNGKTVSLISGTYLGWLEFDGVRYWDLRQTLKQEVFYSDIKKPYNLTSDSRLRPDLIELAENRVDEA